LEVLQECYETVDYISLHHYHIAAPGDYAALMGGGVFFEDYINTEIGLCDFLQTKLRTPKKMMLSFDEYGSRMQPLNGSKPGRGATWEHEFDPDREYILHDPDNMTLRNRRPVQRGDILNALTSASTLLVLLRHADRVKIGCMTRGLNAVAATSRDHVWKSASHYPFKQLMEYGRGASLRTAIECDTYDIPGYAASHHFQYADRGGVGYIDAAAAYSADKGELNVFAINLDWDGDANVELDVAAFDGYKLVEHIQLFSDDIEAENSYENPDAVVPSLNAETTLKDGIINAKLKKLSWNVFRLQK
jgi:alpha-N-arabinofuranosidase